MQKEIKKLQLFVTEDCNLRCDYCYIRKRKTHMTLKMAKQAVDLHFQNIDQKYWYIVEFFGGEPLMRFDFIKKMVAYTDKLAQNKGVSVSYLTYSNGVLINNEVLDFLERNPTFFMNISCDGVKEAHDLHRVTPAGKGSFDIIDRNFHLIEKRGLFLNKKVRVDMTVSPETVPYIYENYKYFHSFEGLYYLWGHVLSAEWTNSDIQFYKKQVEKIIEDEKKSILKGVKLRPQKMHTMLQTIVLKNKKPYICQAGRVGSMTVNTKGDLFLCHRFESLLRDKKYLKHKNDFWLGNINEFDEIDQEKVKKMKNKLKDLMTKTEYSQCKNCEIKKYCLMKKCVWENYVQNFEFNELNENYCKIQKMFWELAFKFHKWLKKEKLLDQYMEGFGYYEVGE